MEEWLLIKAAMLSADVGQLADQIRHLERGGVDGLHFDVTDGRFVPEISVGPRFIRGLRKYTKLPFEVHLLVEDPGTHWGQYREAGADCIMIHVETSAHPDTVLTQMRQQGCQAGLAIKPGTSARLIEPYLDLCEVVNVMTVTPGKPGVLNEDGIRSLTEAAELIRRVKGKQLVQVDGAVSHATRSRFVDAGARALVVGYPIFSREDFGQAIAHMRHGDRPGEAASRVTSQSLQALGLVEPVEQS